MRLPSVKLSLTMVPIIQRHFILLWIITGHVLNVPYVLSCPLSQTGRLVILPRGVAIERMDENTTVLTFDTNLPVTRSAASDGGGSGFSAPSILWLAFTLTGGFFLALVGLRGWRITLGVALGLVFAVSSWATAINSMGSVGLPDLALTLISLGSFCIGVALGAFEFSRIAGLAALGMSGGLSLGIRIVVIWSGFLMPALVVNWLLIAALGVLGLGVMVIRQRIGITLGCGLTGTFLVVLGVDLLVHRQTGMSLGLRLLFDHNSAHRTVLLTNGYHPALSTQIMLSLSIALSPALAYAQHRFFPHPFDRSTRPKSVPNFGLLYPEAEVKPRGSLLPRSRFSL